jgi:hypothetical protein
LKAFLMASGASHNDIFRRSFPLPYVALPFAGKRR